MKIFLNLIFILFNCGICILLDITASAALNLGTFGLDQSGVLQNQG